MKIAIIPSEELNATSLRAHDYVGPRQYPLLLLGTEDPTPRPPKPPSVKGSLLRLRDALDAAPPHGDVVVSTTDLEALLNKLNRASPRSLSTSSSRARSRARSKR